MGEPSQPTVTVIIPHRGADEPLERCIMALRRQSYPRDLTEILVVLNEIIERPLGFALGSRETLLWHPDSYSYAARNMGIGSASGVIIALTDSDTIPESDWLEQGIHALKATNGLVAGAITLNFTRQPLSPAACYEKLFAFDQEKNVALGRATTANLFVRKQLLSSLGPFSDTAQSGEDFRWTSAAVTAGVALRYAPLARVSHPARETMRELLHKAHRVSTFFPRGNTAGETFRRSISQYWTLYVLPPSAGKRESCTPRERTMAHLVALVVQASKAIFLVTSLVVAKRGRK